MVKTTTLTDDAKDIEEVTISTPEGKKYEVLYNPRCFAMPGTYLGLVANPQYKRDIQGEQIGYYMKPLALCLMHLVKSNANNADVTEM